ncbi:flagellar hook capping FlgD N-terminal domain-containing protein [Parvularcula oceani]|uniref:flagellar hook capping FlgD N-terminal domain-containing protein n=1 Tax=Parvularcula oceani TaxID=1247963 RepID=UPI00069024E7|nr:flagellar hook capping FlgD N-terminal domain-containing protein [Parvularcula oceani]
MTTLSPLANAPASSAAAPASGAPQAGQPEELTQFLSLLTTQIRNQDPLTPLDSTAFVEQLATFSSLEQQVQTNRHLESILERLAAAE